MKRLSLGLAVLLVAVVAIVYFVMDRPWASGTPSVVIPASPALAPTVEVTYIANEGILISSGGKRGGVHDHAGEEAVLATKSAKHKISVRTRIPAVEVTRADQPRPSVWAADCKDSR